jgi:hypothetical protein
MARLTEFHRQHQGVDSSGAEDFILACLCLDSNWASDRPMVSSLRPSGHPVLLSSLLFLCNSSGASTKWTVDSSDCANFILPPAQCTSYVGAMHRWYRWFIRWCPFFFLFYLVFEPWKIDYLLNLACGISASLGPRNVYKDMLNNIVSPIDHVVMNHQNHTRTNGIWGHVRYSLPLFCDLWQHKQSKHKFAQIDKIRATYTCLDAYHYPNSPRSNFLPFWSSLPMFTHSLPLSLWKH